MNPPSTGDIIVASVAQIALLSLIAIGGVHVVFPDLYRLFVDQHHWMTGAQFSALIALGQAAPGPNILAVALIGYYLAGFWGAVAFMLALLIPSSLLCYAVLHIAKVTQKRDGPPAPWRSALRLGFGPVTVGVVMASGIVLARAAALGAHTSTGAGIAWAIALAVGIGASLGKGAKLNPLWWLGAAAVIGAVAL